MYHIKWYSGSGLLLFLIIIIQVKLILCVPMQGKYCAKLYNSLSPQAYASIENGEVDESSKDLAENTTYTGVERCSSNYCYSLWLEDENGTLQVMGQGCWVSSERSSCMADKCISDGPSSQTLSYTRFCCCSGYLCNMNMSTIIIPLVTTSIPLLHIKQNNITNEINIDNLTVYVSIILATVLFLIIVGLIIYKCNENEVNVPLAPAGPGYSSNLYNVDNLKLVSMVGKGRYGTVWRGLINEEPVAVKIFPAHHKNYFVNERDLYCLPLISNPSLLTYYGCDERSTLEGVREYLLVLSLATGGCLQDYLKEHILPWDVFCSMAQSIARGIAHLHTDIKKGDLFKPCVCHRDINSRNILVKGDLTCCICDLGFAVKTWGPRYEHNGEQQLAEARSINEVGTLRYMSPEILEGAVNLRDCESALKQIDIYALGLVLWELNTRCSDFYPAGQPIPEYSVPYEKELPHPTFEQMQMMICRHKARPSFPSGWGSTGTEASKLAKETCEDCWDHDAEARLTALCVEERLLELSSMRPSRYPKVVNSPPLNTNNLMRSPSKNHTNIVESADVKLESVFDKNTNASSQMLAFQGRNPCLERNLMATHSDAFSETSVLIDKSLKHQAVDNFNILNNDTNIIHIRENSPSSYGIVMIQNEDYNRSRNNTDEGEDCNRQTCHTAAPIPYLQNVVTDGAKTVNIPLESHNKASVWRSIKNLFERNKLNIKYDENAINEKSNLVHKTGTNPDFTEKNLLADKRNPETILEIIDDQNYYRNSFGNDETKTSLIAPLGNSVEVWSPKVRPNSLPLDSIQKHFGIENNYLILRDDEILNKGYAVMPKSKSSSMKQNLSRQHSLEVFHEVFSSTGDLRKLRDPSQRIKTPGDVPPSVRRARSRRSSNRLSLYDDRMMVTVGHSL